MQGPDPGNVGRLPIPFVCFPLGSFQRAQEAYASQCGEESNLRKWGREQSNVFCLGERTQVPISGTSQLAEMPDSEGSEYSTRLLQHCSVTNTKTHAVHESTFPAPSESKHRPLSLIETPPVPKTKVTQLPPLNYLVLLHVQKLSCIFSTSALSTF